MIKADLHIHSCLSPCGSLDMSPSVIVRRAAEEGLDLIAVTDHNSALNSPAVEKALSAYPQLHCLYGMELSSTEEVHALALFETCSEALSFGDVIYNHLPSIINDPERFGDQVYVDENENILGTVEKLLITGLDLSLWSLGLMVHDRGGLFIPAHVDREMFSIISQLGFLPEDDFDALEFSARFVKTGKNPRGIDTRDAYSRITGSDSHYPGDIGSVYTEIACEDASFESISGALKNRKVTCHVK